MLDLSKVIEIIKMYGIGAGISVAMFLYFNSRLNKLEEKYDNCMNARISEAYRAYNSVGEKKQKSNRFLAVLTDPIRVKKDRK